MRSAFVVLAVLACSSQAMARTVTCVPNSYSHWLAGEAQRIDFAEDDPKRIIFTMNLKTGAYEQNWTDGTDDKTAKYEILSRGAFGDESDFVALDRRSSSLIRIRLANEEFQFAHDHDRVIDIGLCSYADAGQ